MAPPAARSATGSLRYARGAVHEGPRAAVGPGDTTADLDRLAADEIRARGAKPSFPGYNGHPATLCTSVNAEIVHGWPAAGVTLRTGDVLKGAAAVTESGPWVSTGRPGERGLFGERAAVG